MSDNKTEGAFATLRKIVPKNPLLDSAGKPMLDENGQPAKLLVAKAFSDIFIKAGQVIFFNDVIEGIDALESKGIITSEVASEKRLKVASDDKQYNQETLYQLRAGKVPVSDGVEASGSGVKF